VYSQQLNAPWFLSPQDAAVWSQSAAKTTIPVYEDDGVTKRCCMSTEPRMARRAPGGPKQRDNVRYVARL
jgi:hypothetical protein